MHRCCISLARIIPVVFLILLLAACSGDSGPTGALAGLTDEQRRQIEDVRRQLEAQTGVPPVFPEYVPEPLNWLPETRVSEQDRRQWYVAYLRSEEPPPSGDDRPIELFIIESSDEERALFPPCPGPLDEDEEELELDGEPAVGDVIEGTGNAISYAVCFRAGDISVNVNLDWGPQGSPPEMTDQMKEEALRVARSMVP